MNEAHAEATKRKQQERNQFDRDRDRATLKIEKISNGFIVKIFPQTYAFGSLDEVIGCVTDHFGKGAV